MRNKKKISEGEKKSHDCPGNIGNGLSPRCKFTRSL